MVLCTYIVKVMSRADVPYTALGACRRPANSTWCVPTSRLQHLVRAEVLNESRTAHANPVRRNSRIDVRAVCGKKKICKITAKKNSIIQRNTTTQRVSYPQCPRPFCVTLKSPVDVVCLRSVCPRNMTVLSGICGGGCAGKVRKESARRVFVK